MPLVAVIAAGLALWRRSRSVPDAFLPQSVLSSPVFRRLVALGAVGMATFLGSIVLVPVLAARAYGLSGIGLGLALLPMAIAAAVSSPNNARVEARLGRRHTTNLSLAALGLGAVGLAVAALTVGLPGVVAALAVIGVGFGLLGAPLLNELTHAFGRAEQPVAVGVYNLCFFLGGAVGAAISSALVQVGAELPFLSGPVPGFATAELLLASGPLAAAAFNLRSRTTSPLPDAGLSTAPPP